MTFNKLNIGEADVLSKLQMKKIRGGHDAHFCAPDTTKCYVDGDTEYFCFTEWSGPDQTGDETCCCGHDAGNDECGAA